MTETDQRAEIRIAQLATVIAVRRHARGETSTTGTDRSSHGRRDLRRFRLLVGSGGVLRHAADPAVASILDGVLADHAGGWAVPRAASVVVDADYVLAPLACSPRITQPPPEPSCATISYPFRTERVKCDLKGGKKHAGPTRRRRGDWFAEELTEARPSHVPSMGPFPQAALRAPSCNAYWPMVNQVAPPSVSGG